MPDLVDIIADHYPPVDGVGIPLLDSITILFEREMDTDALQENFFIEGPDTDQFIGPGLIELQPPHNISQGDLNDFLRSPGYQGIVLGAFTFEDIDSGHVDYPAGAETDPVTRMTFKPDLPMSALTDYRAVLTDTEDALSTTYTGHLTWAWQTGTGSIEEIPSDISTSVLNTAPQALTVASEQLPLSISSTTPADRSIEVDPGLEEIVVEFNKDIDPASVVAADISVKTIPATDHPEATATADGEMAKTVTISGNQISIKL